MHARQEAGRGGDGPHVGRGPPEGVKKGVRRGSGRGQEGVWMGSALITPHVW
jgi:hypothetical protein